MANQGSGQRPAMTQQPLQSGQETQQSPKPSNWLPVYYVNNGEQQQSAPASAAASQYPALQQYMDDPRFAPQYAQYGGAQGSNATLNDVPLGRKVSVLAPSNKNPHVPGMSYALVETADDVNRVKTNTGNTKIIMALLSEMWMAHMAFILGGLYLMTFVVPQGYTDTDLWVQSTWYKIGALLPLPYTLICFLGLILPFRTPKFLYTKDLPRRRIDNLYILTVTKGANKEAVYRAWNAHKHLERLHPCIRVHVLTDEPYFFENINCYTCPKNFSTGKSKYKARALEWYRQTMRFTEFDWILHLDEESVIDDESVKATLEFIWYEQDCHWGQGVILYNQYRYWTNWLFTVADALRVGDDISRFALQYSYFRRPVFGAHGSFLLTNGLVENAITWDLGSLTEDYQFAMHAWKKGFKCGKVPGIIREQSPQTIMDFLKQRRRWFAGIVRLPNILPKIWGALWVIGSLALYGTIISVTTSLYFRDVTPRWFGILKDFTFCTFIYLYILGIFIQDIDKGLNPLLVLVHIPITALVQFLAAILECVSVFYGILFPPAGFDIIKK